MRAIPILVLASFAATAAVHTAPAPRQELENVTAFARLYGVVRYFYAGDAAAALDWNRFAVLGIGRVRPARDVRELRRVLQELFVPLGTGIEVGQELPAPPALGAPDPALVAWRYLGPGAATHLPNSVYVARRTNRQAAPGSAAATFVTIMQNTDAVALRGKAIRLRGRARVMQPPAAGWAGLWLRVDRGTRDRGFFDNMQDRPVRDGAWREYAIEGTVADDATNVAFGVLTAGAVTADFDAIELAVRDGGTADWTTVAIADAGFEANAGAPEDRWHRAGSARDAEVTRPEADAAEGRRFVRLAGASPRTSFDVGDPITNAHAPIANAHADFEIGSGLKARVRLSLTDAEAKAGSEELGQLRGAVTATADGTGRSDLDVRLADVVVAWNMFRHFYPYWSETKVDWDGQLPAQLRAAFEGESPEAHRRVLQRLVAAAHDGHGGVNDRGRMAHAGIPVQFAVVEGRLVVTATAVPADAPVGAIVTTIDGARASERLADLVELASGSDSWRTWRALGELGRCTSGSTLRLTIEPSGSQPRDVSLACGTSAAKPLESRPAPIVQLEPRIWYVDLTRTPSADLRPMLDELSRAAGIVFDLRGYPTDAGAQILAHLIDGPENDHWMHVARIAGPFGQVSGWHSVGWNVRPALPRLTGKRAFLTDGRAISYAESVMGYVADHKLGTIVGSPTAGTNGNVAVFAVPSGFTISFTGMKVTRHDGTGQHHLLGVRPHIPIEPTLAGIRAGRDEVLERALVLLRAPK